MTLSIITKSYISFTLTATLIATAIPAAAGSQETHQPEVQEIKSVEEMIMRNTPQEIIDHEAENYSVKVSPEINEVSMSGVSLSLPVSHESQVVAHQSSTTISNEDEEYLIRKTETGSQVIYSINKPSSDHSKVFTIGNANKLVPAAELGLTTGEVFVVNLDGSLHSSFDTPWAYDALGKPVPTHFEVSGNTLKQIVDPTKDTVYPIIADPDWGKIAMCTGTILANVSFYIVPGGIIGRLLARVNSIRKAAEIIVRTVNAKSYNDKLRALRNLAFSLGADLTGIGAIAKACG